MPKTKNISHQVVSSYDSITTSKKSLKFLYANVRSIVKPGKFDELKCIIKSFASTLHIVILTETWIKTLDEAQRFQIPGYYHYFNFRCSTRGGGVSIYVHNNLSHSLIEDHINNGNHYLWIHIQKYSLDIGAIYRKPELTNISNFLDTYSAQLHNRKRGITFGDFNINLLSTDRTTILYNETLQEAGYNIINKIDQTYCTRETATAKTIIDHVCSNLNDTEYSLAIIDTPMSDHKQVYFEIKRYEPKPRQKVTYEAIDYDILYKTVKEDTINSNYNNIYEVLENKLIASIKKSKIVKTKMMNPPKQEWINKTVILEINLRNILWKDHKHNRKDKEKAETFIKKRNEVSEYIQHTKSTYYTKEFNKCKKKPRKMWSLINSLSLNKIKETSAPNKLEVSEGVISDTTDICETFNKFFSNVGSILAAQIINSLSYNFSTETASASGSKTCILDKMMLATTCEVERIINNLNSNTSSGIDGINTKSIKAVKNLILHELTHCINFCLENGIFPDSLKIAKVTPIFKSGKKTDPGNYRPISVLPIISKIFERVLYNRLETFLTSINFLYEKQYGFRPKSNTLSASIDIVTKIKLCIDKKQIALGVFIDLKKAFDTVSHCLLLNKLNDIGITGTALKIFKSYLSNRTQVVKIGQTKSKHNAITYGVPQGSILGPLLFLIYINSIHTIGLKGDIALYADDTSLFYFGKSIESIIADAQCDLDKLNTWFQGNLLTINVSKTNYIIFAAVNKKMPNFVPLTINNQPITRVYQERFLGLILDSNLNWKPHLLQIKSKLTSLTGALRGVVRCLPPQVRYTIYNSLVKPHLDYLIEVWGTAAKTNLNMIQIAQNKLIKRLFNYNFLTPTTILYKETKILNILQSYIYNTCILIRKILTKDIHIQITFTKKQQVQKIKLRNANDIKLSVPRTNYGKKSIMYEGAQLYNKLPKDIKHAKSIKTFKKLLKHYLLTK